MPDTWSKIKGFDNYSVSTSGEIRNDNTGKIKAPKKSTNGYYAVDLYNSGIRTTCRVHRIVGETYVDNPDMKPQLNHKDGDKFNNDYTNLEWVTAKENMRHAFKNGLCKPNRSMLGKRKPNAGRHGKPVRIIETGEVYKSITECEKAINGNNGHICDCLSGRQKTHRGYHFEYVE